MPEYAPPGTVRRSPFADVGEDLALADLIMLARELRDRQEQIMAAQDDVNAAAAAISAAAVSLGESATAIQAALAAGSQVTPPHSTRA